MAATDTKPGKGIYKVIGGAAVVRTLDGSERYLYKGSAFDGSKVDESRLEHLVEVGLITRFKTPAAPDPDPATTGETGTGTGETGTSASDPAYPAGDPTLDGWTVKQYEALAAAKGIDLPTGKSKPELLEALSAALAAQAS